MKPNFLNLFMKELTRDRVVPTISASVLAGLGNYRLGHAFLSEVSGNSKNPS